MKFSLDVKKLKNAIGHLARLTSKHASLPVLESIIISAEKKEVLLRATNLHIGMEVRIPATVEEEGVAAIPGATLLSLVNSLSGEGEVVCKKQHENLLITKDGSRALLKTVPYDDFPTLPKVEGALFEINSNIVSEGLTSVMYSASTSDIKPELSSIYIYTEDNDLYFVGTDSFRLAEKKINIKDMPDIESILLPFKSAVELSRILTDMNTSLRVVFNKNQISFAASGFYITSRLVDGTFPDYRQILPKDKKTEVIILKQDLLNIMKASTAFTDKFNQITFHITPKEKKFILESKNTDIGEFSTELPAAIEGEPLDVNLNYRYFLEAFQSFYVDSLSIRFTEPTKPMVISGVGQKDFLYLIMPLNR